jgi:hypothetical protein
MILMDNNTEKMNIGIVGSRRFNDYDYVKTVIDGYITCNNIDINGIKIVSGGAAGVDSLAKKYADEKQIECIEFLPEWKIYGNAAGRVRNRLIAENSNIIFAFPCASSTGTYNTVSWAQKMNVPCEVYSVDEVNAVTKQAKRINRNLSDRIFTLEICFSWKELSNDRKRYLHLSYPFKAWTRTIGYYSSLKKAEEGINEYIDKYRTHEYMRDDRGDIYCFFIHERKVDQDIYGQCESHRSYNPGGYPEKKRFNEGDTVEVTVEDDKVCLGIVFETPDLTKKKAQDCGDDCYTVVFPNDREKSFPHTRQAGWQMFSPRLRVPQKMQERLEASYKYYKQKRKSDYEKE